MTSSRPVPRMFLLLVAAILTLAVLALLVVDRAYVSRTKLPVYGAVPFFEFLDQDSLPFSRDSLLGKVTLIYFGFTRCHGSWPATCANSIPFTRARMRCGL